VTAPAVSGEGDDPSAAEGVLGLPGGRLVLSGAERTREALLSARIAVEHVRVVEPSDSRTTARYASQVVDNSRRLAGADAGLHLSLLAGHVAWLSSLPAGLGGLR
jgi:hypothetical protein